MLQKLHSRNSSTRTRRRPINFPILSTPSFRTALRDTPFSICVPVQRSMHDIHDFLDLDGPIGLLPDNRCNDPRLALQLGRLDDLTAGVLGVYADNTA